MILRGQHVIFHALLNTKRKSMELHSSTHYYSKLLDKLNGLPHANFKFIADYKISEPYLKTNEAYVEAKWQDFQDKILLVDNVTDANNLATIIRSAAVLSWGVLLRNHSCPINEVVINNSSGGVDQTPIKYINNTKETIDNFKKSGFIIIALDEKGEKNIVIDQKIVLVIGAEGSGLSKLLRAEADIIFSLNTGTFSTFNAAVAASIGMYYFA